MTHVHNLKWQGIKGVVPQKENQRMKQWETLNYGMFIHWGLYSEIGGVWEGEAVTKGYSEQIQMWAGISETEYLEVARQFKADKFDPDEICLLAKKAGMKYVLMTTKHHDGFCMFDTNTTTYNIVEKTPYGKDPLKLLSEACERHGLKFGIYYSLVDWHQGHKFDENNNNPIPMNIETIIENQLTELLTNYGEICEIWFDMSSPTEEQSHKFIEIVRKYQPKAAINSRIWNNLGDFRTLDDNEIPSVKLDGSWQTPASIYRETWGYRKWQVRDQLEEKVKELLKALVGDGNYLLNIGPRGDGSIVEFEDKALQEIGAWLNRHPNMVNTQATLFDTPAWGKVKYNYGKLYLIIEELPENEELVLPGLANKVINVIEDGTTNDIMWEKKEDVLTLTLPDLFEEKILPVIEIQIEGELEVIPEKTIVLKESQENIDLENVYSGHGYHELGNYNSMQQVVVRYTTYLLREKSGNVFIQFNVDVSGDKKYRISLGDSVYEVNGYQLKEGNIGPFAMEANHIYPLNITLAKPKHEGDPLKLTLKNIVIHAN